MASATIRSWAKVAYVRVLQWHHKQPRNLVYNATQGTEEKVTQVRRNFPGWYEDTGKVEAGDLAGICGLRSARVGDLLGVAGRRYSHQW
jgi:ribosomal protection tetracycline resistance protein